MSLLKKLLKLNFHQKRKAIYYYIYSFQNSTNKQGGGDNEYKEIIVQAGRIYEVFVDGGIRKFIYIGWEFYLMQGKISMDTGFSVEYINDSGEKALILPCHR
ncbi:Uncharacterized protein Rs2_00182 [Raphanus sativus]|nr:Uncharacterized protein Rs2_00182 [Raphanus sativus]